MAITSAIGDFFSSIYELLASIVGAIYNTLHALVTAVLGLFSGVINLVSDVFKGAVDVVGGLGKFLLSNFVVLGLIVVAGVLYVRYQSQQGRPVTVGNKKLN